MKRGAIDASNAIVESIEEETTATEEKIEADTATEKEDVIEETTAEEKNDENKITVLTQNEDGTDLEEAIDLLSANISLQQHSTGQELPIEGMPDLPEVLKTERPETVEVQTSTIKSVNFNSGTLMDEINTYGRSANSVTQQFIDYITSANDQKYVTFGMTQGQILNVTLSNPANNDLDYDLVLTAVAEDGTATGIKSSELGSYVDSQTGKTVDEGISYVHTDEEIGMYAIFVVSSSGSSTTESFTLTVSLDEADSYDSNEPNDSPFEATAITGNAADGSLHVVNDQDWYAIQVDQSGIYSAEAGSAVAEIYYVVTGNRMVLAPKFGRFNYELESGITYYVKVYSDKASDNFTPVTYTLELEYLTRYETMSTAFNYGPWENSGKFFPDVIPMGQQVAYFKFAIDPNDRAYANCTVNDSTSLFIGVLNAQGKLINYGSINVPDVPDNGIIIKRSGSKSLVVDMDGDLIGTIGYIMLYKGDRNTLSSAPFLDDRIRPGYGTFTFSGTAQNSGGGLSSAITLNLSNNSAIPPKAYVTDIQTQGTISSRVMGVDHMLNPGGLGWMEATSGLIEDGDFRDIDTTYGIILARQSWQFAYYQTALQKTTMSRVKMTMEWKYDINTTNYESYQ